MLKQCRTWPTVSTQSIAGSISMGCPWIRTRQRRSSSAPVPDNAITAIDIGTVSIPVSNSVKILGVTIDDTQSFSQHVISVCKSSSFHLRALQHIRKWISEDTAKSISTAAVARRLDYCNSVLYGLSATNKQQLQHVQNYFSLGSLRKLIEVNRLRLYSPSCTGCLYSIMSS